MKRLTVMMAVLIACGNGKADQKNRDEHGSGGVVQSTSPFATPDEAAAALGAYFDQVGALLADTKGDCGKLKAGLGTLRPQVDALAIRVHDLVVPADAQARLGKPLAAKLSGYAANLGPCSQEPEVLAFFQSQGWIAVRHTAMTWSSAIAVMNTTVDPQRCDAAVGQGIERNRKGLRSLLGRDDAGIDDIKRTLASHCAKDKWSAEVVTCFETMDDNTKLFACISKLPRDQNDAVTNDMKPK